MRNMSFSLTTPQILARSKTVTRRMGWGFLRPGDLIQAVENGMGLKKGEKIKRLGVLRVVDVRRESLACLDEPDVVKEGFEGRSVEWFAEMFARTHHCDRHATVTRIQFEYESSPDGVPVRREA